MRSSRTRNTLIAALFALAAAIANAAPPDDGCALLTPAQANAVLGVAVGPGVHTIPNSTKSCTWAPASAAGGKSVSVRLKTADAFNQARKLIEQARALAKAEKDEDAMQLSMTPVTDIGADAYYSTDGAHTTLNVRKGTAAFEITVLGDFPNDELKAIEKTLALQVLPKL